MKTLETEDLHSSESCTVPMFWIPVLIIPGMAEGREVFLSASLMFQSNTTKSIPTLYSFPNPSMPGLSLHIKCSLQILPSQKITQLKTQCCIYLMYSLQFIHSEFIRIPYLSAARGNVLYYSIFKTAFDGSHQLNKTECVL